MICYPMSLAKCHRQKMIGGQVNFVCFKSDVMVFLNNEARTLISFFSEFSRLKSERKKAWKITFICQNPLSAPCFM